MEDQKARQERKEKVKLGEAERVKIPPTISVRDFAAALNLPIQKVMQELMHSGILASLNERIDFDTASIVAEDLGFICERVEELNKQEDTTDHEHRVAEAMEAESKENLAPRPPVIVVMGHVDHGKPCRSTPFANTRHRHRGRRITQHIGYYQVKNGRALTFIDTPGHEAFTVIRSRGAKVATSPSGRGGRRRYSAADA